MKKAFQWIIIGVFMVISCTPKVTETVTKTTVITPKPAVEEELGEKLSPCKNWVNKTYKDEAETAYVLTQDYMKLNKIDEAYPHWQKIYDLAPAADGKRKSVFEWGIKIHKEFYKRETTDAARKEHVDRIMTLYDELGSCYETEAYAAGRKAFDYYYFFSDYTSNQDIYRLFRQYMDEYGEKANYFVLNPFSALLIDLYFDESGSQIPEADAKKYAHLILGAVDHGLSKCKNSKECEPWKIVQGYAPERLSKFETVKGFFDCDYYIERYYNEFENDPQNCDVIETVYSRLKWGGCKETDVYFARAKEAKDAHCKVVITNSKVRQAYNALGNGEYSQSVKLYKELIEETDDKEKKATWALRISKIYFAHLKSFSKSRMFALEATKYKQNWGEPYLLIGKLYASSGPLCGPGRGWDSQVVTWPAIDMFSKAKSVDPSVSSEANKWINRYSQYMPNIEDIFQRGLKEGDTFFVPCWIQRSTKIRAARN